MSELITYEYPLHERSRTLLRLEHCFRQYDYHASHNNPWETRAAMLAMLDVSAILARADIKSDLIKEMERQSVALGKMRQSKGVDTQMLEDILLKINNTISSMHNVGGQLGKQIRDNEFLKSIQQRTSLAGGDCDFDLPLYYHWLAQSHSQRQTDMQEWIASIQPLRDSVELLLMLIRGSAVGHDELAENGFFQKTLDGNITVQMIRIVLHRQQQFYPEVSGGKHRFSIRFMQTTPLEHPQQTSEHISFNLTTCVI